MAFAVREDFPKPADELPKPADERQYRAGSGAGKPRVDHIRTRGRRPEKLPLSKWEIQEESKSSDRELLTMAQFRAADNTERSRPLAAR